MHRCRSVMMFTKLTVVLFVVLAVISLSAVYGVELDGSEKSKVKPIFTVHNMPKVPGIVFQAETVDAINIHFCGPDQNLRPLTDRFFAKRPSVSPDGQRLFFQDSEDIPLDAKEMTEADKQALARDPLFLFQIYSLDVLTGKRTRISDGSSLDSIPVAGGGNRVAFCSRPVEQGARWEIVTMNYDGSGRRPLGNLRDGAQLFPSWSPGADKIVYIQSVLAYNEELRAPAPKTELMIYDLKKGTARVLPTNGMILDDPCWSPLGDRIAFTVYDIKTDRYSLWQINIDGSGMKRISEGPDDQEPAWFPDGRSLLFVRGAEGDRKEIYMLDLKSRAVTRLISASNASCERPQIFPASVRVPVWDPDSVLKGDF